LLASAPEARRTATVKRSNRFMETMKPPEIVFWEMFPVNAL
jgi:hypothetical protein